MTDEVRDDAALLRAHLAGDRDAFGELVTRHRERLWAVALRTMGDREDAADALQDALLSAYRAADRFRGDSAVTTWLHRIVVNACLDRIRRQRARPTQPLPEVDTTVAPAPDRDMRIDVEAALAQLPVEQRAALVLVDVQGYPVSEAAEMLGVAEGTIKSRCARGRARMALALAGLRGGSENGTGPKPRDAGHAAGGNQQATQTVSSGPGGNHPLPTPAEGRDER